MNKETLEKLINSVNIEKIIDQVITNDCILVPDNFKVEDIEEFKDFRNRYRFYFSTKDINDFIQYCERFSQIGSQCFIHDDGIFASCIFDLGTLDQPLHQDHKAQLEPNMSYVYKIVNNLSESSLSQIECVHMIEDLSDCIALLDFEEKILSESLAKQAFRDITIEKYHSISNKIQDFSSSMSSMENVEAKNDVNLPRSIVIRCSPYMHLVPQHFKFAISLDERHEDKPKFRFRWIMEDRQKEQIKLEFKVKIQEGLKKTDISIYSGKSC